MRKIVLLLPLFILFLSTTVHAASLQEEKAAYEKKLQQIDKDLEKHKTASLEKKRNETAAFVRAYKKAIEYTEKNAPSTMILRTVEGNFPPQQYIGIYKRAGKKYGVDWTILAAIHKTETQFSTISNMVSSAGAVGHMQFMPKTWDLYGVDANGDGKADPWNLEDAIFSAANYLAATGAASDRVTDALFSYNHSTYYGQQVKDLANTYKQSYTKNSLPVVDIGKQWIGKSAYVFGGGRSKHDTDHGIFDCSSFVYWAYEQEGIKLGNQSSVTTDTLKNAGKQIPFNNIQVGDLVFFDTYKKDGHVGIYAGNNSFIGAQESTGVAIASLDNSYWKSHFNGRVVRVEG